MIDPFQTREHRAAAPPCVRTKGPARPAAGDRLDVVRRSHQRLREDLRRHEHVGAGMRMKRHGVALCKDATNERSRLVRDVTIDQEEGRANLLPGEHIQERRRRSRIGTVIEGQIDGRGIGVRHMPHRTPADEGIEHERRRRCVCERDDSHGKSDQDPHRRSEENVLHHPGPGRPQSGAQTAPWCPLGHGQPNRTRHDEARKYLLTVARRRLMNQGHEAP
jgi:hypothetical protein